MQWHFITTCKQVVLQHRQSHARNVNLIVTTEQKFWLHLIATHHFNLRNISWVSLDIASCIIPTLDHAELTSSGFVLSHSDCSHLVLRGHYSAEFDHRYVGLEGLQWGEAPCKDIAQHAKSPQHKTDEKVAFLEKTSVWHYHLLNKGVQFNGPKRSEFRQRHK